MRRIRFLLMALMALSALLLPSCALAATRALLIACSEFSSQPDLGAASSGNLHLIGSALIGADPRLKVLSFEDGTIGTREAFESAVTDAMGEADEDDLSILYLCTHGVLSSSDDGQVYLLLGDGEAETPLSAQELFAIVSSIQGEKLVILDACYSGALIGRGLPAPSILLPGEIPAPRKPQEPVFLPADPSIHVLTSADGTESSWYFDSDHLATGAISYFASAFATGLGLYGSAEADANGDGSVSLAEMQRYLNVAVPSSSSQLLSAHADGVFLPTTSGPMLSRPLSGFTYGSSLLLTDDPTLEFSFTAAQETAVQYRLIDYDSGRWNWEEAQTFLDEGDDGSGLLTPGRKTRSLTLPQIAPQDSGYLMLQVFSVTDGSLVLCSERLIAVQPAQSDAALAISCRGSLVPGLGELPIIVETEVPVELTVSVLNEAGATVRRLASGLLTRPASGVSHLYWDGRDDNGNPVLSGRYTVSVEALIGGARRKASCEVILGA